MLPIENLFKPQTINNSDQKVQIGPVPAAQVTQAAGTNFDTMLQKFLQPQTAKKVSEEELFSALVMQRITDLKGDATAQKLEKQLAADKSSHMNKADGFVYQEDLTTSALKDLVKDGTLSKDEGDQIYSEAFAAAQFDSNKNMLFDSRGTSVAVTSTTNAISTAKSMLEQIASGDLTPKKRDLSKAQIGPAKTPTKTPTSPTDTSKLLTSGTFTPTGTSFSTDSGGLTFNPEGGINNLLAITLPSAFTNQVKRITLLNTKGDELDSGDLESTKTKQGKYNFSMAGKDFPSNLNVEVRLNNGKIRSYIIPDPTKSYT